MYNNLMLIRAVLILCFGVSSVIAQPRPLVGEGVDAYLDRWDEWLATIPQDQRAMTMIEQVDAAMDDAIHAIQGDWYWVSWHSDAHGNNDYNRDWEWTVAFIESHPQVLESIRQYSTLPIVGDSLRVASFAYRSHPRRTYVLELSPKPIALDDIAPEYLSLLRQQFILLMADANLAIEQGNDPRLLADLQAVYGLVRLSRTTGGWLDELVKGAYAGSITQLCLNPRIDWSGVGSDTLLAVLKIIDKIDGLVAPVEALEIERVIAQEKINWLSEDQRDDRVGPLGVARLIDLVYWSHVERVLTLTKTPESKGERLVVSLLALIIQRSLASLPEQLRRVDEYFDAAISLCELDSANMHTFPEAITRVDGPRAQYQSRFVVADHAITARNLWFNLCLQPTMHNAARLRLVLEIHHRRHGVYPNHAIDLDSDLEQHLSIRTLGMPLQWKIVDDALLIYWVGPDRDDDNGRPILDEGGSPMQWPGFLTLDELKVIHESDPGSVDGDWVLFLWNP